MQKFMRWSISVSKTSYNIVLIFVKKLWENEWSCITSFIYLHYYKIVKRPCRYIEHIFKDPLGTYCMLVSEPKYVFRIFAFVYFLVSSPRENYWLNSNIVFSIRKLLLSLKTETLFITIGWIELEIQLDYSVQREVVKSLKKYTSVFVS